jgi:ABC-2 type transport system ATP-binding protein
MGAIDLRGLTKAFAGRVVVEGVSLTLPRGASCGLVGRNGAGKSTTVRMATGLLRPDAGAAEVAGIDVWADPVAAKARLGVLTDDPRLFERLSGSELLFYLGLLRGLPRDLVEDRAARLLAALDLRSDADQLVLGYSSGTRKKIGLAAALLHGPDVLFLDEPFEGVDPVSARALHAVLEEHRAAGGTLLLSSHDLALVERTCDHAAVLHEGRLVASGPLDRVCGGRSLQEAYLELIGSPSIAVELPWLGTSSG